MSDIIKLLPDSIANQIAAGEVIQRPASVVKELLENAVDAGADQISLVLKESGKVLIQVSDNGSGMSDTDARMCFERHATSKIKSVQDIFRIVSKGFRGEALASIAAISHVEMITRDESRELGTRILIEGSSVKKQEMIQSEIGTNLLVKNLFFNTPARRKFLKSDAVELKHITDEFVRVALAHPDITFSMYHNGNTTFHLPASNHKQRLLGLLGKGIEKKILPVEENMELFQVKGFIGNIDLLQKTKHNQYLFVNNRYIKNHYLNHAITSAYSDFNTNGSNPFYVLFIDINPSKIDINIHPTKQEIKFEDERLIYNYLKVAVKHVIGKNIFAPRIGFDEDATFRNLQSPTGQRSKHSEQSFDSKINPPVRSDNDQGEWEKAYEIIKSKKDIFTGHYDNQAKPEIRRIQEEDTNDSISEGHGQIVQVFNDYLFYEYRQKIVIVNIRLALQRIRYDELMEKSVKKSSSAKKQLIFPVEVKLEEYQNVLNEEFLTELRNIGIDCERKINTLFVKSIPEMMEERNIKELIESSLVAFLSDIDFRYDFAERFAAKSVEYMKQGLGKLSDQEKTYLLKNLFKCDNPVFSPGGDRIYAELDKEGIAALFD
jgi:DNA mismatch repair protein MutL